MIQFTNALLSVAKWSDHMSTVLYYTTIVLSSLGALFALTYLIMNAIGKSSSLNDRNAALLSVTRASMILSLIFALLTCLLGDASEIDVAILTADKLYTSIAITWLGVILASGISLLCTVIFKKTYSWATAAPIKKLFHIALWAAIIALVLAWLLA